MPWRAWARDRAPREARSATRRAPLPAGAPPPQLPAAWPGLHRGPGAGAGRPRRLAEAACPCPARTWLPRAGRPRLRLSPVAALFAGRGSLVPGATGQGRRHSSPVAGPRLAAGAVEDAAGGAADGLPGRRWRRLAVAIGFDLAPVEEARDLPGQHLALCAIGRGSLAARPTGAPGRAPLGPFQGAPQLPEARLDAAAHARRGGGIAGEVEQPPHHHPLHHPPQLRAALGDRGATHARIAMIAGIAG